MISHSLLFAWLLVLSLPLALLALPSLDEVSARFSLLDLLDRLNSTIAKSRVKIFEQKNVPDLGRWSICENCGILPDRKVVLLSKTAATTDHSRISLSSSHWKEFFYSSNDEFLLKIVPTADFQAQYLVRSPVFIVPMITTHPGHWIVDLLEGLYHAMMSTYGQVRRDAIVVLDVAGTAERNILREFVDRRLYDMEGEGGILFTVYQLLFALTRRRVVTAKEFFTDMLPSLPPGVVFERLHVGLDTSKSYYYHGYRFHPHSIGGEVWNTGLPAQRAGEMHWRRLAGPHRSFQQFLQQYLTSVTDSTPFDYAFQDAFDLLLVQRNFGARVLLNRDEVPRAVAVDQDVTVVSVPLENIPFYQQLQLFREAKVLLGVAGTTFHNLLFSSAQRQRRGEHAAVILMQSADWCQFSWMYSNQAVLLGSKAAVICPAEQGHAAFHDAGGPKIIAGLHRRSMQQGSRITKALNITVDIDRVLLPTLRQLRSSSTDSSPRGSRPPLAAAESRLNDESVDWSMRTPTDVYATVADVQDSVDKYFVSDPADADDRRSVKMFASIVGPSHEVRTLLDHRHFPTLSICQVFASGTGFCLPVERYGYYGDSRLHLKGDDLSLGVRLSLTADTSLRVEAHSLPDSASFFGGSVSFFLRNAVVPVALPIDARTESPFVAIRRTDCWFRSDEKARPTPIEAWSLPFMRHGWLQQLAEVDCHGPTANVTVQVPAQALFWRGGQLLTDVASQRTLQRRLHRTCAVQALSASQCVHLASMVYRDLFQQQVLAPAWQLPPRQWFPTPQRPFVFLHMEKCAGTTVRALVDASARRWGLDAVIPCYSNMSCFVFDLPAHKPASLGPAERLPSTEAALFFIKRDLSQVSIVAGHFQWGVWQTLPSCGAGAPAVDVDCAVAGFVMMRHPVERVVSQYYERVYSTATSPHHHVHLNELSEEALAELMRTFRWGRWREDNAVVLVDEGMSDVYCRSLLGRRTTSGRVLHDDERDRTITISSAVRGPGDVDEALRRLNRLVVGLQDRWSDTLQVLSHWFPWIEYDEEHLQTKVHATKAKEGVDVASLKPSLRRVIEDASQCDLVLYNAAVRRFDAQMRLLRADGSEAPTRAA